MALSQGFHHTNRSRCRNYPWGIWSELTVKTSKGALSNGCRQEQMYVQVPYSTQAQQFSVWGNWYGNPDRLVKIIPNHQQKPFLAHDNGCILLWLHFPWNSLNFWLELRRNSYWHSKHTLLSELNKGNWDIDFLHSSGTNFVSQYLCQSCKSTVRFLLKIPKFVLCQRKVWFLEITSLFLNFWPFLFSLFT